MVLLKNSEQALLFYYYHHVYQIVQGSGIGMTHLYSSKHACGQNFPPECFFFFFSFFMVYFEEDVSFWNNRPSVDSQSAWSWHSCPLVFPLLFLDIQTKFFLHNGDSLCLYGYNNLYCTYCMYNYLNCSWNVQLL